MKWGEVNMPVEAPRAASSAARCATVEPLPLVPPTVTTANAGSAIPRARATAATRVSSMSMLFGCTDSCSVSHSASVRIGLAAAVRSEEHTSELQSQSNLVCRLLLEKKKEATLTVTYELMC